MDATPLVHAVRDAVARRDLDAARALVPDEAPYPLPEGVARRLGADVR